jgi:DNA-binding beta-propeller fold protein YncE
VIWIVPVGDPGGIARALAIDLPETEFWDGGNPWVGMWAENRFFKLDEDDGAVLETVDVDVQPYGAAIDRDGWIWISGMRPVPGYIQRFHTRTLSVDPRIDMTGTGCDSPSTSIYSPYGIAIDIDGRVWVGSWSPNACRYDPSDGSFFTVALDLSITRGVAADGDGTIWASNYGSGSNRIVNFDMDDGTGMVAYDIAGVTPIGVGVDELGQIWTVNQTSDTATRLVKSSATLNEHAVGTGPYTYSDFTGYQRELMTPSGRWEHVFERCNESDEDHWGTIEWDVSTPPGSRITIYGFSADHPGSLATATPVLLAEVPPDTPPEDIEAAFHDAAVYLGIYLRVVVILEPAPDHTSPVFRSVDVHWHCTDLT